MTDCVHHWLIPRPNGAVSEGRCKLCGATCEFVNSNDSTATVMTRMGKRAAARRAAAKRARSVVC